jgi:hypothetical protein
LSPPLVRSAVIGNALDSPNTESTARAWHWPVEAAKWRLSLVDGYLHRSGPWGGRRVRTMGLGDPECPVVVLPIFAVSTTERDETVMPPEPPEVGKPLEPTTPLE